MSMKKISEGLWKYKGYEVRKDSEGNYKASGIYVNDLVLPITIVGATQKRFIEMFNRITKEQGGLSEK